jgi:hypothetical protein
MNIKMNLVEIGCAVLDWIHLAQDRDQWWFLVKRKMNISVPYNVGNVSTSCMTVTFSRETLFLEDI